MTESQQKLANIIESLLFCAHEPVTIDRLCHLLSEFPATQVRDAVEFSIRKYEAQLDAPFGLVRVANGVQFRTTDIYAQYVKRLFEHEKIMRLRPAALETLACVAYRQPIIKSEIDEIRGVDCAGTLKTLIERGLVCTGARRSSPGRPLTHITTDLFLSWFGLQSLDSLPALDEFAPSTQIANLNLAFGGSENDDED